MLGTNPQYQRTGAGSALVRWGMAKADEEGVALYLDATDGEHRTAAAFGSACGLTAVLRDFRGYSAIRTPRLHPLGRADLAARPELCGECRAGCIDEVARAADG